VKNVAADQIGYDRLVRDSMRQVIRGALAQGAMQAGKGGGDASSLPGAHHFYITFRTRGRGVVVPDHLRERYPDEMTIVLEHQFWDLESLEDRFRVLLKFGGQPHQLVVPYAQITRFLDPSVPWGIDLTVEDSDQDPDRLSDTKATADTNADEPAAVPAEPAQIVSLDAFRKK
jgi:uncharacterized protein